MRKKRVIYDESFEGSFINGFKILNTRYERAPGNGRSYVRYEAECPECHETCSMRVETIKVSKSCGCKSLRFGFKPGRDLSLDYTHRLYPRWKAMLRRCDNPKNNSYPDYGGRGIKVCERWKNFQKFIEDMGLPSSPASACIERKDNDGDYCPENCLWADRIVQANNRRSTVYIFIGLDRYTLSEFAKLFGVKYYSMKTAIRRAKQTGILEFKNKLNPPIDRLLLEA